MPSPPLLDIPALLAPIPGDDPAGSAVPFEVRQQLEEARVEEDPDDFAPDDPMRPEQARKADWKKIARLAEEALQGVSKNLLVAARLTEALVKLHGFAGFRDGLRLLRELVDQCWDRLTPPIEDGDVEGRAAPFYWLDDPDKGARFPTTLRTVPLVVGEDEAYSWLDWRQSQTGGGSVSREAFEKAILATPREQCEATAEAIAESRTELHELIASLSKAMGPAAPGLTGIQRALEECHGLMQDILRKCPVPVGKSDIPNEAAAAGPSGAAGGPSRAPASREEAYRRLAEAASLLRQLEPHSPIPYLVERAVELGALPFPQMIRVLIRDANVLNELSRELGLKEPPQPTGE